MDITDVTLENIARGFIEIFNSKPGFKAQAVQPAGNDVEESYHVFIRHDNDKDWNFVYALFTQDEVCVITYCNALHAKEQVFDFSNIDLVSIVEKELEQLS